LALSERSTRATPDHYRRLGFKGVGMRQLDEFNQVAELCTTIDFPD
jgi:hypothetical protein